jgi:hypothetical protein
VFVRIHLRPWPGVRHIVLYMVLYCITCTQAVSGLYNEAHPLSWVCGVCPIFYTTEIDYEQHWEELMVHNPMDWFVVCDDKLLLVDLCIRYSNSGGCHKTASFRVFHIDFFVKPAKCEAGEFGKPRCICKIRCEEHGTVLHKP